MTGSPWGLWRSHPSPGQDLAATDKAVHEHVAAVWGLVDAMLADDRQAAEIVLAVVERHPYRPGAQPRLLAPARMAEGARLAADRQVVAAPCVQRTHAADRRARVATAFRALAWPTQALLWAVHV